MTPNRLHIRIFISLNNSSRYLAANTTIVAVIDVYSVKNVILTLFDYNIRKKRRR